MGKILLVTDNMDPDEQSFKYARQLCRFICAELSILQIYGPNAKGAAPTPHNNQVKIDDRLMKLISKAETQGIQCDLTVKSGNPDNEIARYVETHRDIILAVDDRMESKSLKHMDIESKRLAGYLLIPIVRVHTGKLIEKFKLLKNIFMEVKRMGAFLSKISNVFTGKRKTAAHEEDLTLKANKQVHQDSQENDTNENWLVVVGRESDFSDEIVDYALEMAERMNYQILALNTAQLSCDTFKMFSSSRNKVCGDFEAVATQNAAKFEASARRKNIAFTHVVKFVETDEALEELEKEFGGIGFIVSEPENRQAASIQNENRPASELCVYSLR